MITERVKRICGYATGFALAAGLAGYLATRSLQLSQTPENVVPQSPQTAHVSSKTEDRNYPTTAADKTRLSSQPAPLDEITLKVRRIAELLADSPRQKDGSGYPLWPVVDAFTETTIWPLLRSFSTRVRVEETVYDIKYWDMPEPDTNKYDGKVGATDKLSIAVSADGENWRNARVTCGEPDGRFVFADEGLNGLRVSRPQGERYQKDRAHIGSDSEWVCEKGSVGVTEMTAGQRTEAAKIFADAVEKALTRMEQ